MTRLPLTQLLAIQPTKGHLCNVCGSSIGRPRLRRTPCPPDASHAIPPRVLRFEASRHARIPSPSCLDFGLCFEDQTKKPSSDGFAGKPPNPARSARPPPSLLTRPPPCTGSIVHDFVLLVSPPCGPHLVPPSTGYLEPSLLVSPSPGGPSRLKTFRARSSPATTRTRPQPTPAHGAKSQSNTRCQSLITEERSSIDHRDAPGPQSPP
jgi:hypothetical protein